MGTEFFVPRHVVTVIMEPLRAPSTFGRYRCGGRS
jgi:hypothetical protein